MNFRKALGLGPIVFQTSTDLVDWQNIQTNGPSTDALQLSIPAPDQPRQFYRAYEVFPARGAH